MVGFAGSTIQYVVKYVLCIFQYITVGLHCVILSYKMSRKLRSDFTLQEKIEILDKIRGKPSNTPVRELEKFLNVPKSTIARLKKNEIVLREKWNIQIRNVSARKQKREGKDPNVDDALNKWFELATGRGVSMSGPILKRKVEELAEKMCHEKFLASEGLFSRWKVRHEIVFKKAQGEKQVSADSTGAEEWCSNRFPQLLDKYVQS